MCDHCGCRDLTCVSRLMDEHDRLRELSTHIRSLLAAGDDAAARAHFDELLVVLGPHVMKEEGALFPMLRRSDDLAEHVAVLEAEHAGLYGDVDELDDAAAQAWRDGLLRLLEDLSEHMYKEDFGLFPAALATLDGAAWDAMDDWEAAPPPVAHEPRASIEFSEVQRMLIARDLGVGWTSDGWRPLDEGTVTGWVEPAR
jgi:hemerythrin-like domain-containing protein